MSREPDSIVFEADYWKAVLEDMLEAHDLVVEVSRPLAGQSINVLALIPLVRTDAHLAAIEGLSSRNGAAMDALTRLQEVLMRLGEVAKGRLNALYTEAGLEPPEVSL